MINCDVGKERKKFDDSVIINGKVIMDYLHNHVQMTALH